LIFLVVRKKENGKCFTAEQLQLRENVGFFSDSFRSEKQQNQAKFRILFLLFFIAIQSLDLILIEYFREIVLIH
jgi:hypothetical protein